MKRTLTPFIDATYYEAIYKPVKSARISGSFVDVDEHKVNFDPFRERASELVDRVLMNKISALGGFYKMSDTFDKECIMQATAAIVELWFIKGYTPADIDATFNIGGISGSRKVDINTFRDIVPFTALALLQKTSMFNKQRIISVDMEKELADYGIKPEEIVTWGDALNAFELKGLSLNFHIEGDLTPELGGQAGVNKYILVASTSKKLITMDIVGGVKGIAKSTINIERNDAGQVILSEALIYTNKALDEITDYYYELDGDKINIYMQVKDDQKNKIISITNVYPDDTGSYGVLGSKTNSVGMTKIGKTSVIGNVVSINNSTQLPYFDTVNKFLQATKVGEMGRTDGVTPGNDLILIHGANGIVQKFETAVEIRNYIDEADANIQKNIDDTKQVADEAFIIAKKNEGDIVDVQRKGTYRGNYATEQDINNIASPKNGDFAVREIQGANPGDKVQYQEYIYDSAKGIWEAIGSVKDLHPLASPSFLLKEIQDDIAYAVNPQGIGSINVDRSKFNDIKNKDNVILDINVGAYKPIDNSQFDIIEQVGNQVISEKIRFSSGDIAEWNEVKDKIATHSMLLEKDGNNYFIRGWVLKPKTTLASGGGTWKKWDNVNGVIDINKEYRVVDKNNITTYFNLITITNDKLTFFRVETTPHLDRPGDVSLITNIFNINNRNRMKAIFNQLGSTAQNTEINIDINDQVYIEERG